MTEGEFIRFYKKRNNSKNHKEVKEKIDLFRNALLKALDEEGRVALKDWGTFEKKEVKPRKIMTPKMDKATFTEAKEKIRFKAGRGLQNAVNGADTDE
ncbi:HU family DNA-binding protein [Fusobacterium varium]|uniref:HU family DNA-binding protein n=1 Tax=Fusobacterium varium TaxID=856 RepID=UPI000E54EF61|nr:HU family DNA-binding protein [Fusobacterium varium]RHG32599.1 HU family DNA-binding protein [Fusobacterium varium]